MEESVTWSEPRIMMGPREPPLEMWPVQLVKVREEREMAPVLGVVWAYQSD